MRSSRTPRVCLVACLAGLAVAPPALAQEGWEFGAQGLSLRRADFRFQLGGYVQADFRSYHDWQAGDEDTGLLRSDTAELRRLRIGFEARYRRLTLELDVDPQDEGDELKNAYANLRL